MSYCRITGKAKGLPKPNYFPLLPPISAADARRFCRITGKSYGLPTHCYIPVVLSAYSKTSKCKITNSAESSAHLPEPDYGRRKHIVLSDFRYMTPIIDESNEQQQILINVLNAKTVECDQHKYIYSIKEQKCNLVFSAKLEAAVRDGDISDVMFATTNNSILLYLDEGKSVSLELEDMTNRDESDAILCQGEGPSSEVKSPGQKPSRRKRNGKAKAKINGDSDVDEKLKTIKTDNDDQVKEGENVAVNNVEPDRESLVAHTPSSEPTTHAKQMRSEQLNSDILISSEAQMCESIPNQNEIIKIMQNYSKGIIVNGESAVSSLYINIGTDELPRNVVIYGCIVNTSEGDVFVAGRTIENKNDSSIFEPGIYVQSSAGPVFIPGQIIYTEDEGKGKTSTLVACRNQYPYR